MEMGEQRTLAHDQPPLFPSAASALQPADRPKSDRRGPIDRAIPENSAVILFFFVVSWLPNCLPFFDCGFAALRLCGANCMDTAQCLCGSKNLHCGERRETERNLDPAFALLGGTCGAESRPYTRGRWSVL